MPTVEIKIEKINEEEHSIVLMKQFCTQLSENVKIILLWLNKLELNQNIFHFCQEHVPSDEWNKCLAP